MIPIFPCGSRRSGVPFETGDFLRLLVGELGTSETWPNFRLWQMAIPIHNATIRGVRSGPKMSENAQFWGRMYFPTKYLRTCPHFGVHFNAKPILQRALRHLHVNRATTLKLYCCIGIGKYLEVCQKFSTSGRSEGAGPLNVNLGPPVISETTGWN